MHNNKQKNVSGDSQSMFYEPAMLVFNEKLAKWNVGFLIFMVTFDALNEIFVAISADVYVHAHQSHGCRQGCVEMNNCKTY